MTFLWFYDIDDAVIYANVMHDYSLGWWTYWRSCISPTVARCCWELGFSSPGHSLTRSTMGLIFLSRHFDRLLSLLSSWPSPQHSAFMPVAGISKEPVSKCDSATIIGRNPELQAVASPNLDG